MFDVYFLVDSTVGSSGVTISTPTAEGPPPLKKSFEFLTAPPQFRCSTSSSNLLKVEFGLIRENGNYRILGAGLLSAPDEMEYAMSDCPNKPDFDPAILAKVQFDDTTLQELLSTFQWYSCFCSSDF